MIEQREFPVWFSDAAELASDYYVVASAVLDDEAQRVSRLVQDTTQTFVQQSKDVALGMAYLAASMPSTAVDELRLNASVAHDWGTDLREDWRRGEYGMAFWQGVEDINHGAERVAEIDVHIMSKIDTKEGRQQLLDEGRKKITDAASDAAGWGMYASESALDDFKRQCLALSGKVGAMRFGYGTLLKAHAASNTRIAPSLQAAKSVHRIGSQAAIFTVLGAGVHDITKAALAAQSADDELSDAAEDLEATLQLQQRLRRSARSAQTRGLSR